MKSILFCKIIAAGIVVLFVGVTASSAISVDTNSTMSNNQIEECKECNEVSDADLIKVERLLDRVEVYGKFLMVLSIHHPELREMSEELSNQLSSINKLYDEFNTGIFQQGKHPICNILEPLYVIMFLIMGFAYNYPLLFPIVIVLEIILNPITQMMTANECDIPF